MLPEQDRDATGRVDWEVPVNSEVLNLVGGKRIGYLHDAPGVVFSSSLYDRTMLRRPSASLLKRREEGCSSTAFGKIFSGSGKGWGNQADRGFLPQPEKIFPALP